jgi:hypothetical protein
VAFNMNGFPGMIDNCLSSVKRQLYHWLVFGNF